MSAAECWVAYTTLVSKEIRRFLRIWTQTLLPSTVTVTLYLVVFGRFLGDRIRHIEGYSYIEFIVPGLIMMATLTNSFSNVASSFFSTRFQRSVEELLVSPIPDWLIIAGYTTGGAARGLVVGVLVLGVSLGFTTLPVRDLPLVLVFVLMTAVAFALGGFMNALFARKFDDIAIVPTFVLTPLTYFGGVFYSIDLLPPFWRNLSLANPILYMVNGFRYGFLGVTDIPVEVGLGLLSLFILGMFGANLLLMRRGVGLRS